MLSLRRKEGAGLLETSPYRGYAVNRSGGEPADLTSRRLGVSATSGRDETRGGDDEFAGAARLGFSIGSTVVALDPRDSNRFEREEGWWQEPLG
eukprot:CAMPEP_0195005526 /NCGR_PEP_ID=MMETSP0326_2-20130528/5790_1 /TAXON_ID=2866 ORGANISM="Crypthecodinium cohnii, Strain Seligo" /NCGR_SAMPLE_ID=MMETSP0326_2 /ASSEMBLY_ACC=CAM_ASM_000348 /LENGTH=93 /DNA_ID=CAMNT_0040011703 /DNA_START=420 /DNA_END=699 /DNA_ORIENTATION=-